ncbi:MAG: hypothetical protein SF028_07135 [Candidatus Sumerlaeia bacterium]|nr:hypothetical protein [Candidatus Sumerlaeia bacterium]
MATKRSISTEEFIEALGPFDLATKHLGITLWRVCTERLGSVPYAQPSGGPITKVIFGSDGGTDRPWLAISFTRTKGMWFELVGGSLISSGEWYDLECPQGGKSGERWMQIRAHRTPTPEEVADMGRMVGDAYGKWKHH